MWIKKQTVTILNTESLSEAFDLGSNHILGMIVPTGFNGSAITLSVSVDGVDYYDLYSIAGAEVSVAVSPNQHRRLDADIAVSFNHFKLRTGTSGTPVAQTQDVVIELAIGSLS